MEILLCQLPCKSAITFHSQIVVLLLILRFGGEIKEWDITGRVGDIRVPTLVINGRADISMDFVVKPLAEGIKDAKWVTFEKSSHAPMWEEREKYMQVVEDFLSR